MIPGLLVILALFVIIIIHELGHFLTARAVGIRATKFYLFFGPTLAKIKRGEVEYGIGSIPLGGYVKLPGMFQPSGEDIAMQLDRFAYLLKIDELSAESQLEWSAAVRRIRATLDADLLGAELVSFKELLTQLSDDESHPIPGDKHATVQRLQKRLDGFIDDCHPAAYWRADLWRRMAVIFAGPMANVLLAFVVMLFASWLYLPHHTARSVDVIKVENNSPAWDAGMRSGDQIVTWNGTSLKGIEVNATDSKFSDLIRAGRGKPTKLTWKSGKSGETRSAVIIPEKNKEGRKLIGLSGFDVDRQITHTTQPLTAALDDTAIVMREVTVGSVSSIARIFKPEVREQLGSVVGAVTFAGDVDRAGDLVRYVAILSLSIAIINLLPLLPLDGGYIAFGIIEALRRGRALPRSIFERYAMVGLALVLVLFYIGVRNDIGRI